MVDSRITKSFNIHGLVRVLVESRLKSNLEQVIHHLAEFEETEAHGYVPDVIIRDYADAPDLKGATTIAEYYFYSNGNLKIPSHKICFNLVETPIMVYCDRLLLPLSFLIHLRLLLKGFSLIHSAAVEFEGRHYLFPALGGVGKTTLVATLVFAGGKLYGDDMCIVSGDEVLSYPQDFSVYPYHVALLRLNDRKIVLKFKKTAFLNNITNFLERYDSRPVKLIRIILNSLKVPCVNVPPKRIFGGQCFAQRGVIDEIYYLSRTGSESKGFEKKRIEPRALAKVCTDVLFHEWHESLRYLYVYSALSPFSVEKMYSDTRGVLEQLFTTHPCSALGIPSSMTNNEYQDKIIRFMRNRNEAVDV